MNEMKLDKTPGAIALRLRWYGTGEPELVFVERKTHRDSWTGESSVKERFIIKPKEVPLLLSGNFPKEQKLDEMRRKGKSEEEIADWDSLATEVIQAINSKQRTFLHEVLKKNRPCLPSRSPTHLATETAKPTATKPTREHSTNQ